MSASNEDRPHPQVTAPMLRDIGLFGGLDEATLEVLANELHSEVVEPGSIVIEEGNASQVMFVVVGGELEVVKKSRAGGDIRVALFGPGNWFGEMSILDVQPRSATVRALAPTMLLRMTSVDVEQLYRRDMKAYALLIMNIARELSRRLRVADGLLAQFMSAVSDEYVRSDLPR